MAEKCVGSLFSGLFGAASTAEAQEKYREALAAAQRFLAREAEVDDLAWDERTKLANSSEETVLRNARPVRQMAEALRDQELAGLDSQSEFVN